MTAKKFTIPILLVSVCIVLLWPFVGVYKEREWGESYLFLKHRPSLKVMFYSPLGEADRSYAAGTEGYLSPEQVVEEAAYSEFVEKKFGRKRSIHSMVFYVVTAILLALSVLSMGLYTLVKRHKGRYTS